MRTTTPAKEPAQGAEVHSEAYFVQTAKSPTFTDNLHIINIHFFGILERMLREKDSRDDLCVPLIVFFTPGLLDDKTDKAAGMIVVHPPYEITGSHGLAQNIAPFPSRVR
tara:strand:- start:387 stop:716 length:330 start_codon:yes stop_codon:yes gene_type:complete